MLPEVKATLENSGVYAEIGEGNFFEHTGEVITCARRYLNTEKCIGGKHLAFRECAQPSSFVCKKGY